MVYNLKEVIRKPVSRHSTRNREEARRPTPLEMSLQKHHGSNLAQHDPEGEYLKKRKLQELAGHQLLDTEADGRPLYALTSPHPPATLSRLQQPRQPYAHPDGFQQVQQQESFLSVDPSTGTTFSPATEYLPSKAPVIESLSYDFHGVPVMIHSNPMHRAKEIIVQRYAQEFRGMTGIGEGLIRRLVDADLESERAWFEKLVQRGGGNEELVAFAERMMSAG